MNQKEAVVIPLAHSGLATLTKTASSYIKIRWNLSTEYTCRKCGDHPRIEDGRGRVACVSCCMITRMPQNYFRPVDRPASPAAEPVATAV